MNFLKAMFREKDGTPSSMRLLVAVVVVVLLGNWTMANMAALYDALWQGGRAGLEVSLQMADVVALVGSLGAKGYQKKNEK